MNVVIPFDGLFFAKSGKKQEEAMIYIKKLIDAGIKICVTSHKELSYTVENRLGDYFNAESLGIQLKNVDSYQMPLEEKTKFFQLGLLVIAEPFSIREKVRETKKLCIHENDEDKWPTLFGWLMKIHCSFLNNPGKDCVPVLWDQDVFFFTTKTIDVLYDNFDSTINAFSRNLVS